MIAAIFLVALALLVWGVVAGVVGLFIAACIRVGKGPEAAPPATADDGFGVLRPVSSTVTWENREAWP